MFHGQGALYQVVDPESLFCSLAFGTVPVTAAIVAVSHRTTLLTSLLMPAKGSSAALGYFAQDL
jgi:hypothetical protein